MNGFQSPVTEETNSEDCCSNSIVVPQVVSKAWVVQNSRVIFCVDKMIEIVV